MLIKPLDNYGSDPITSETTHADDYANDEASMSDLHAA